MKYTEKDHTFVLCAYKENEHLEECIESITNQSVKSNVIVSTSTPNEYISNLCEKYGLKMYINENPNMLGDDWNYGYERAETKLVTIAHQDDLYEKDYAKYVIEAANKRDDTLIIYTDYYEVKMGKRENVNTLLVIKRIMNFPMLFPFSRGSKFIRRRVLSFGCPICCPSVTFLKDNVGHNVFNTQYKNSCDYATWIRLSKLKGAFIYVPKMLMAHRIYAESTTTQNLQENIRKKEDLENMCEFWPRPIAKAIDHVYSLSEKSNKV